MLKANSNDTYQPPSLIILLVSFFLISDAAVFEVSPFFLSLWRMFEAAEELARLFLYSKEAWRELSAKAVNWTELEVINTAPEPASGHLHQGGIWISWGGGGHKSCCVCVCIRGGGAICDRVQLLMFAKALENRSRWAMRGDDGKWGTQ